MIKKVSALVFIFSFFYLSGYAILETRTGLRKDIDKAKRDRTHEEATGGFIMSFFKVLDGMNEKLKVLGKNLASSMRGTKGKEVQFASTLPDVSAQGWEPAREQIEKQLIGIAEKLESAKKIIRTAEPIIESAQNQMKNIYVSGGVGSRRIYTRDVTNDIIEVYEKFSKDIEKTIEKILSDMGTLRGELRETSAARDLVREKKEQEKEVEKEPEEDPEDEPDIELEIDLDEEPEEPEEVKEILEEEPEPELEPEIEEYEKSKKGIVEKYEEREKEPEPEIEEYEKPKQSVVEEYEEPEKEQVTTKRKVSGKSVEVRAQQHKARIKILEKQMKESGLTSREKKDLEYSKQWLKEKNIT